MTRDETVALFLECEAKRKDARIAGIDEERAHEAAKAHWNAWSNRMLAKRKVLEEYQPWVTEGGYPLAAHSSEMLSWMAQASVDFSGCLFHPKGANCTKGTTAGKPEETKVKPLKSVITDGNAVNLTGFVFPHDALFDDAVFTGYAWFDASIFKGDASFRCVIFKDVVSFSNAVFTRDAIFVSATFEDDAPFHRAIFKGNTFFTEATFAGSPSFSNATLQGEAFFVKTSFGFDPQFDGATTI